MLRKGNFIFYGSHTECAFFSAADRGKTFFYLYVVCIRSFEFLNFSAPIVLPSVHSSWLCLCSSSFVHTSICFGWFWIFSITMMSINLLGQLVSLYFYNNMISILLNLSPHDFIFGYYLEDSIAINTLYLLFYWRSSILLINAKLYLYSQEFLR